jgi:carboxyl-terminal processing protease
VQELDNALLELAKVDVKALILDLRGNSGGLMDAAIEVAERFLSKGMIIVSTQHYDPKYNTTYRVRNEQAFALPMVVLVDGDTASAAEVLAGALKDNNRARLVGQTTFGKGCSQEVVRLPSQGLLKVPPELGGVQTGAIRITVARFLSPGRQPYSGRGVVPHRLVERQTLPESLGDNQIEEARSEAQRLIDPLR